MLHHQRPLLKRRVHLQKIAHLKRDSTILPLCRDPPGHHVALAVDAVLCYIADAPLASWRSLQDKTESAAAGGLLPPPQPSPHRRSLILTPRLGTLLVDPAMKLAVSKGLLP